MTGSARRQWLPIVGFWAVIAAALALRTALQWGSVPLLGDSDDAMRLVTAADLLGGQAWQDLVEHRDNAPFGAPMHWSRLVDAPLALLLAMARPLFGPNAPNAVAIVWPLLLLLPMLALAAALVRRLVPEAGMITALALPMVSFVLVIEFLPGRVDHHNVQILLCLGAALAVLTLRARAAGGIASALAMTTSIAIGLETLPMLVMTAAAFACLWLADPRRHAVTLAAFGSTLALGTLAHFLLATPPAAYAVPACDMLSITYAVPAVLGGAGLVAAAVLTGLLVQPWQRLLVLSAMGAVTLAVTAGLFPHCLAGPYAAVEGDLQGYFTTIAEAQPIWVRVPADPATAVGFALATLLAVPVTAWRAWRSHGDVRIDWLIVLGFLAAGALVMVLQMRGARLAAVFALPAAAWVISRVRQYYLAAPGARRAAALLGSWLLFAGVAHYVIVGFASELLGSRPAQAAGASTAAPWQQCFTETQYRGLAALPPGIVMSPAWNGAHVLHYTPHAVVSAGFHRNVDGYLAAEAFFAGDEERARQIAVGRGVDYVAFCPSNRKHLMVVGPDEGRHWSWLEPVAAPDGTLLRIYRVRL